MRVAETRGNSAQSTEEPKESSAAAKPGAAKPEATKPDSTKPPTAQSAGARALVRSSQGPSIAGVGTPAARVETARSAAAQLAQRLPGHDVDLDGLARSVVDQAGPNATPRQLQAAAQEAFVRAALSNHPELADRAVSLRLAGADASTQSAVKTELGRRGLTGIQRYAEANRMAVELSKFSPEERGDIAKMVERGEGFWSAVQKERAELARPLPPQAPSAPEAPPTPVVSPEQHAKQAVAKARDDLARLNQEDARLRELAQQLPRLDALAERSVGLVNLTAIPGELALASVTHGHNLEHAKAAAIAAGENALGVLTAKTKEANALYLSYLKQSVEYRDQSKRYQTALETGDHATIVDAKQQLQRLDQEMQATRSRFEPLAKEVIALDQKFDAAVKHAFTHVVVSSVASGLGAGLHGAVHGAKGAAHGAKEAVTVADKVVEQGVEKAAEAVAMRGIALLEWALGGHPPEGHH